MPPSVARPVAAALAREDDRRISALESQVALIAQQQQTLSEAIGEVKAIVSRLDSKLDTMVERLIHEHAEPEATPAGRQVNRAITTNLATIGTLSGRVDSLEQWRDELRGSMTTLRFIAGLSSIISAAAIIISAAHAAHLL